MAPATRSLPVPVSPVISPTESAAASRALRTLWIEPAIQIGAGRGVTSTTVIVERGLVVIKRTSLRLNFGDVHGREVKKLSELPIALPDLRFRLLCLGDIHRGPDKFHEVARLVQDRRADNMEALDGTVGENNAVCGPIIGLLSVAPVNTCQNEHP